MTCTTPECGKKIFARGLCQACYYRQRRNGTVERKNMVRAAHCTEPGCTKPVLGRNLCTYHYKKTQHPMTDSWKLLRSRNKGDYPAHWDRFEAFLEDVGERPTIKHQLRRTDGNKPYSAANVRWQAPVGTSGNNYTKEQQAAYGREWNLQRRFGITGKEYAKLASEQGGKCAVCLQPETAIDKRNGEPKALAVDHDHSTGKVRGLLCRDCNTMLGLSGDKVETLRAAIAYLEKHSTLICEPVLPPD